MGDFFEQLPENIQRHIRQLAQKAQAEAPDIQEKYSQAWLEKRKLFEEQTSNLNMVEVESFSKDDGKGALMLTYSGSLISVGPVIQAKRWAEYASIEMRVDVPNVAKRDDVLIANDANVNSIIEFERGPIKSSSQILKIVVCREDVALEEQDKRIREATIFLTNSFMRLNKAIITGQGEYPDEFTTKSIIEYLALKNNLTQKKVRELLSDFGDIVEAGIMKGARVPIVKLGNAFLKKRPAQKARVGRNPATGEEITIGAKPECFVPKMVFRKNLKEKAQAIPLTKEDN